MDRARSDPGLVTCPVLNTGRSARAERVGNTVVVRTGRHREPATRTGGSAADRQRGLSSSRNIDQPRMRDITLRVDRRRRGLGAFSSTWGESLVFHKNCDGNPDAQSFPTEPWEIWLGARRGGFTFDRSLPPTDRRHCEAADFAGPHRRRPDGRTDLYCVRGAINGTLEDRKLWPA